MVHNTPARRRAAQSTLAPKGRDKLLDTERSHARDALRLTAIVLASTVLLAGALLLCCATPEPPPPTPDRSLGTLDRLIAQQRQRPQRHEGQSVESCRAQADAAGLCPDDGVPLRTVDIRLALDPRYMTKWPAWRERLSQTLECVNTLYRPTGVRWRFATIQPWDPGAQRHELYGLLYRLQRELPPVRDQLTLGITVWDENKVYRMAGGEIGLSQRASCVVPSWPRVENDCVILAHELGHLIGARHLAGKHMIMGWAAAPFYLPTSDPLARVVATYRFHPRNVAAITAHRSARFTPHGLRPRPACKRRIVQIDRCWSGS